MYIKSFLAVALISFQINGYSQNSLALQGSLLNNSNQNSTVEESSAQKENLKSTTSSEYHPHMVFIDPLQLFFKQFTLGYEYNNPSNDWAVRLPVSFGIGKKKGIYTELGLDFKYYLTENDTFDREVGPLHPGYATFRAFAGPSVFAINYKKDWLAGLRGMGGVSWQFVNGLNISGFGALGPAFYLTDNNAIDDRKKGSVYIYWSINGSFGYRF